MSTTHNKSYQSVPASATLDRGRLSSVMAILGVISVVAGAVVAFLQQREIDAFKTSKPIVSAIAEKARSVPAPNEHNTEKSSVFRGSAKVPGQLVLSANVIQLGERVQTERYLESLNGAYGPLMKRLNLDPTKAEQFKKLLVDERHALMDALQVAKAEGIQSPQDYISAVKAAVAQIDLQIQTLLGADNFEQFQEYRQTLPEEQTVARLADRLANTTTPLSEGQQDNLVRLLNEMEPASFRQNEDFLGMMGLKGIPLTSSMVSASASVLTPPQVQMLDTMQKNLQAREQMVQTLLQQKK